MTNSSTTPIPSHLTLTNTEIDFLNSTVVAYNQVIVAVGAAINATGTVKCGVMDAEALFDNVSVAQKTHFLVLLSQGMDLTSAAATTYFSLDGIHPNNVGYGLVANGFIDIINALDGTSIPRVDVGGLIWDPTYGVLDAVLEPMGMGLGKVSITAEAAVAMDAAFR